MNSPKTRSPRVSIIVLTFNALGFVRQCLASVKRYSKDYELIAVDNNSRIDTVRWLEKQAGIVKIFNPENRGFAAGNNQGIKAAKGKYIVLLNSDTVVTKNWLSKLADSMERDDRVGITGPYSNYAVGAQRIPVSYPSIKDMHAFAKDFNRREKETCHVSGFCMMIKRDVRDKVGLFDERFKIGNFEDVDYCIRAARAGFKLKVTNCFIHHFGSRSFMSNVNRINVSQVHRENFKVLVKKWRYKEAMKAIPPRF